MTLVGLSISLVMGYSIMIRYVPIRGLRKIEEQDLKGNRLTVVDLRDYQNSSHDAVDGAINIPLSYLERQKMLIPKENIMVIVSTSIEKNLGVRQLRKKGYNVVGYLNNKKD
ncbi:hypothetical protein LC087_18525 [Bacillus carboniphilus]|uniref:Rhodanese domain-containing protein n=1 Tax=Bacillus carboniphilus TaxID=86663 RepID=A0ABY9JYE7_9BACI|nr:hypothetical protein [Bacillus carboniphilus]WLR42646.1 hypothetical protein LC087_18525 [Bacillus carboniphilus]